MPTAVGPKANAVTDTGPESERLEIAIDANHGRVLRSSLRPQTQVAVGGPAWAAFIASIRAGQDY